MKWSKRALRSLLFFVLRSLNFAVGCLPWRAGVALGGTLGFVAFYLLKKDRQRSYDGLRVAFGADQSDSDLAPIARKNFCNLGKSLIEILNLQKLSPERIEKLITLEGEEYLKEAQTAGQGTILITGHIGNWELMAAALSLRGYPLNVIAAPLLDPRIDDWIVKLREKFKVKTISRGSPSASRKILGVLRSHEILGLLIDQDTRVDGVFVNFFNKKAHTPAGAAQLALRSNAATMMCFVTRLPGDRHKITIEKPMRLYRSGDKEKDIQINTAIFTERIEEHIKAHPDQWVWMHRRWRTLPVPNSVSAP